MALIKKFSAQTADSAATEGKSSAVVAREAEAQRKKARTLAKQQQAAERVAAATGQLASGVCGWSSRSCANERFCNEPPVIDFKEICEYVGTGLRHHGLCAP